MKDSIHFEIRQTGEEQVTPLQLEMLSRLLDKADRTSILAGTLHVQFAYTETLAKFRADSRCSGLRIIADSSISSAIGGIIPELNDLDPTVGRWLNDQITRIILENSYSIVIDEKNHCYAKLSATDGMEFADGTPWDGLYGNSFKYFPRVYYHGEQNEEGKWQYLFSLAPIQDAEKYWEASGIGTYLAGLASGKLISRPNIVPTASTTMSNFHNYAITNDNNYGIMHYSDWLKLNALFMSSFGTRDSKSAVGYGLAMSGSAYYGAVTGKTAGLGDGSGEMEYDETYKQVKLFGIEAPWGQLWQFCPGIRFDENGERAVVYKGNIVSNTAEGRTFAKLNNASSAYTKKMALGEHFDLIPTVVGGGASQTQAWTTGCWASTSGQLLLVGGASDSGALCGCACAHSNSAFSRTSAFIGARLAFYGDLGKYTLVDGAKMLELNT